jgi:hypothetical protein
MKLIPDLYREISKINWFFMYNKEITTSFPFDVIKITDTSEAHSLFVSEKWIDAKTEAQGDLTGYLSKYHAGAYAGIWNILAKQSRQMLETSASGKVKTALNNHHLPENYLSMILLDVNRAILELTYRQAFPKIPVFFENLLTIYKSGYLPCGWNGELENWPLGKLLIV